MIEPAKISATATAKRCPTCGLGFEADAPLTCPKDGSPLEDALADAFVGTVLAGTYRVTRMLAAGGMGRVYEAVHVRLDRKVVVKVMLESHVFKPDVLERADREAQAIARIRSENVVDVIDVLRTQDGRPCLVVDYLEGEDLGARLSRAGRLPIPQAVSIARQLCAGMHAAHAVGVVHRDLKPSNVFLVSGHGGEVAKILDFGVAKLEGGTELTQTGALVGTPAYMAPEQALNAGRVDARTDVYAIAAILYHMLTGVPPYGTEDPTHALMELLKGDPPRARSMEKSIPEELEGVLEHAMARDPLHRTPSVERLAEELEPFSPPPSGGGARVAGSEVAKRAGGGKWSRPLAVGLTAAAAVLGAGWAASFSAAVLMASIAPASPTELQRIIVPVSTAVVGLAIAALGLRTLVLRWRSLPRIEGHRAALARGLAAALIALATGEIAALAHRGVMSLPAPPGDAEHAVALGVAAVAGLLAFTVARWRT